jgi:hypothetical protein
MMKYIPYCISELSDDGTCPRCSPVAVIERKISRMRFARNPVSKWAFNGYLIGIGLGAVTGPIFALVLTACTGNLDRLTLSLVGLMMALGAGAGAFVGAVGVVLYKSLVRPILLALFNSDRFKQEYGKYGETRSPDS